MATQLVELESTQVVSELAQPQDEGQRKEWLKILRIWRLVGQIAGGVGKGRQSQSDTEAVKEMSKYTLDSTSPTQEKHFRGDSAESVPSSWIESSKVRQGSGRFVLQRSLKTVLSFGRWKTPASDNKDVEMMRVSS